MADDGLPGQPFTGQLDPPAPGQPAATSGDQGGITLTAPGQPAQPAPIPGQPFTGQLDQPPQGAPPMPPGQPYTGQPTYHGSLLPFSTDAAGNPHLDWNAGIPGALKDAFTLPGDVFAGKERTPYSPSGMSPDLMPRTAGLASTITTDAVAPQLPRTAAPTGAELKTAGSAAYDALNKSGINVQGAEVANLADAAAQNLTKNYFPQTAAPETYSFLDLLRKNGDMDFSQFNALWQRLNDTIMKGGTEGKAAKLVRDQMEEFWGNLKDAQMVPGSTPTMTPDEASQLFKTARGNFQGAFKSDELAGGLGKGNTGMLQQAEQRAAATNSGQNEGNLIRQRITSFLQNDKNLVGYSPEEVNALREAAKPGVIENLLRFAGNRGSLWSALGAFLGEGGVASAVGVGAGTGLAAYFKGLENSIARRGLEKVDEMVRQNTPLGSQVAQPPAPSPWLPGQPYPTTASPPYSPGRPQLVSPPGTQRLIAPGLLTPNQNRPIPWWQLEGRA